MAAIALCRAAGLLAILLGKLTGRDGAEYLENLNGLLRGTLIRRDAFPLWKTIFVGVFPSPVDMLRAIKSTGRNIDNCYAEELLSTMPLICQQQNIELVKVSVEDLDVRGKPTLARIFQQVQALGYNLTPQDTGPQLLMAYPEQEIGEIMHIGMPPIVRKGSRYIFTVNRSGIGQYLSADTDRAYRPEELFVFSRSRNSRLELMP
jgi:hypothetical protein